jgi:hypothetical protein
MFFVNIFYLNALLIKVISFLKKVHMKIRTCHEQIGAWMQIRDNGFMGK